VGKSGRRIGILLAAMGAGACGGHAEALDGVGRDASGVADGSARAIEPRSMDAAAFGGEDALVTVTAVDATAADAAGSQDEEDAGSRAREADSAATPIDAPADTTVADTSEADTGGSLDAAPSSGDSGIADAPAETGASSSDATVDDSRESQVNCFAFDETYVYWAGATTSTIVRAPK
jgi:hypothetical protein